MRSITAAACILYLASPAGAQETRPVVVTPVIAGAATSSGQPIVLPQHDAQVVVSTYDIAAGAVLPEHKHPFPRYGYVLAGTLRITNTDTGQSNTYKTGDFILESVGQWHKATPVGDDAVKLLVIDLIEKDQSNTVIKK